MTTIRIKINLTLRKIRGKEKNTLENSLLMMIDGYYYSNALNRFVIFVKKVQLNNYYKKLLS